MNHSGCAVCFLVNMGFYELWAPVKADRGSPSRGNLNPDFPSGLLIGLATFFKYLGQF